MKVMRASKAGFPCNLNLWYSVNNAVELISERTKRIFAVGNALESTIVEWLRSSGWNVRYNPGSQNAELELTIPIKGGILAGHPDCFISGSGSYRLDETILVDIKTMNERAFINWKRYGTEKDKPQYVDQVHIYAQAAIDFGIKVDRLGIVGMNKNNCDIHIDFFDFSPERVRQIIERTEYIFAAKEPPEPGDRMQDWCCSYCGYSHFCKLAQKKKDTHVDNAVASTDDPAIINAIQQLLDARQMAKDAKDFEDEAKAVLDKEIRQQGIKSIRGGNFILTLTETSSSRFDSAAFKKAHPDIANEFVKNISSVRYDIKEENNNA